jgi:hypothetical protein
LGAILPAMTTSFGPVLTAVIAITSAALLTVVGTSAQTKPNFSGTWVYVSPAESAGQEQTIKHDATTFTTSHASEGGGHSFTYQLDGTDSPNEVHSHGDQIATRAKATWAGDQLVIVEVVAYPDGRKLDKKTSYLLDPQGQLNIEIVAQLNGKPSETLKAVLKKKGPTAPR